MNIQSFSTEARNIIQFMIKEMSSLKYGYKFVAVGCYQTAINAYHFPLPRESQEEIVDAAIVLLRHLHEG